MIVVTYDEDKAQANLKNHGVDFEIAKSALFDDYALTTDDFREYGEVRKFTIGMTNYGDILVVVWTPREPNEIRIISARKANAHQRRSYENVRR